MRTFFKSFSSKILQAILVENQIQSKILIAKKILKNMTKQGVNLKKTHDKIAESVKICSEYRPVDMSKFRRGYQL